MKSLLRLNTFRFLLLGLITLSSCTLHKRVHRPGYHISSSFKGKEFFAKKEQKDFDLNSVNTADSALLSLNQISITKLSRVKNKIEKKSNPNKSSTKKLPVLIINTIDNRSSTTEECSPVKKNFNTKHTTKNSAKKEEIESSNTKMNNARKLAIIIGLSLLLMALLAGLSVPILNKVFSSTSPLTTFTQIGANKSSFLGALFGWIGIFLLDLLVAWGVWKYYKEDDMHKAKTSGILRLIYSILLGVAILQLFKSYSTGTALVAHQSLTNFFTLWNAGLIVFGIHLMVLAFLYKADTEKKWLTKALSIALFLGGLGYVLQYATYFIFPQQLIISTTIESLFIVFMILGEIGFAVWMLVKGGKNQY